MTKEDFGAWKAQIMTSMFYKTIDARIDDVTYALSTSAGQDRDEDNMRRGYISACRDILSTEWEEPSND